MLPMSGAECYAFMKKIKTTKKPLQLRVVSTYAADDPECNSDALSVSLSVGGKKVLSGDWYHDKIDEQIEGFIKALDHLVLPYEVERVNENDLDHYNDEDCEDENQD